MRAIQEDVLSGVFIRFTFNFCLRKFAFLFRMFRLIAQDFLFYFCLWYAIIIVVFAINIKDLVPNKFQIIRIWLPVWKFFPVQVKKRISGAVIQYNMHITCVTLLNGLSNCGWHKIVEIMFTFGLSLTDVIN